MSTVELLSAANAEQLYIKKTEAAEYLADAFPTSEASGAIASFPDGADNIPLKSCVVNIEPVQAGSGDPSPDNVRAISGWTGCNIYATGRNLANPDDFISRSGIDQETGEFNTTTSYACSNYIDVSGVNSVTVRYYKISSGGAYFRIARYDANKALIDFDIKTTQSGIGEKIHVTDTSQCVYIAVMVSMASISTLMVCEQFATYPISLGQTVYGGTLNPLTGHGWITQSSTTYTGNFLSGGTAVTGGIRVNFNCPNDDINRGKWSFQGNIKPTSSMFSGEKTMAEGGLSKSYAANQYTVIAPNCSTLEEAQTLLDGLQLVYVLANPIEIQLSPTQITTLLGQNNVWADSGDISVTYRADPALYIDGQVAPIRAMVASEETGTTSSRAYTAGQYFILDGQFCKALTNIASGATFTLGTNYQTTTIGAELYSALHS